MNGLNDRRLEVFIGATRRDLKEARVKVQEGVLESGHFPSGMEIWNSETTPVLETIRRRLDRCDVHILIIGARYGEFIDSSVADPMSFTEWEFRESQRLRKPVIVFMIDDDSYKMSRKTELKADPSERDRDWAFQRFRKQLRNFQFSREFANSKDGIEKLGRLCVSALNELGNSQTLSTIGWIRVENEDAIRAKAIRDNRFLTRVIDRLRQFQKLTDRVRQQPKEKQAAAEFFWDVMAGSIRRRGFWNLFFESGSSIAYLSQQFEDVVLLDDNDTEKWNIRTNNVETLLQLLLHTDLNIHPFPPAAPDPQDKYGAIFPREFRLLRESAPTRPRELFDGSRYDKRIQTSECDALRRVQDSLKKLNDKVLVLATTSGLDLSHKIEAFRGPHVGSHPNMLFKRAIMTTGFPVVLFLDSKKFAQPFKVRECFPVFGPECTWSDALKKYPMAICMAWDESEVELGKGETFAKRLESDVDRLRLLGFDSNYAQVSSASQHVVIAANSKFTRVLPMV